MKTVLLFDIDGTLILNSNAGMGSYLRALEKRHHIVIGPDEVPLSCGKTDFIIVRELLDYAQLSQEKEHDSELVEIYLSELKEELKTDPGVLAPGLPHLLERLAQEENFILALGTGNLKEGAFLKLDHHQLAHFFNTGGFAEDGSTRSELIAAGVTRVEELHNVQSARVVIIGDTPSDIQCAHDNDYYAIAVATGSFTREQLAELGPVQVLDDLSDAEGFVQFIRGLP